MIARFGPKAPTVAGLLVLAAGMAILSLVRPDGSFLVDVLPASLIAAAGMSLAFIPSLGTAIQSAAPRRAAWRPASSTPATRSAPRSAWP